MQLINHCTPELTIIMQDYLQAIYDLSQESGGVRITDIAAKRQKTLPSVCVAMRTLEKAGLIRRSADRLVFLTDVGRERAAISMNKSAIIRRFLVEVMDISHENATSDAQAMEYNISHETLCAFCRCQNAKSGSLRCIVSCQMCLKYS